MEDTSSLVNYYYICDEYVTLTLPSEDFKRVADTSVKVNGVAQSMNSDKESITVSTQNKASMSVYYSEEGYYDANTNKVKDGKYGLGFSGGASWYEQSTARYNYFISIERQSNASCLDLSLFDVEITARGNNGANYAITLNEEEGEFSFTTGSVDTITIQGVVKTKITGEVIDSYSLSVPVVEK